MYNEELLKIRALSEESNDILENAKLIKRFLYYHGKDFKYLESIEALQRIKIYLSTILGRRKEIDLEVENIRGDLAKTCSHSIYINEYPYYCPICGNKVKEGSKTRFIIDKFDKDKYGEEIENIVLDSKDESEAENKLLNYFNGLQFTDNVKIRRKVLWKERI